MTGMSKCSKNFAEKFQAILEQDQKKAGVMTIFKAAMELLLSEKIAYVQQSAKAKLFFVHPKNRAGLGVSWHNAHRNGARIKAVGADKSQLQNAYAMEMGTDEELKYAQVQFNQRLIGKSDGLLAEQSGEERYLSLGCGHTVAFAKAADSGCRTSQPTIADENGKLDLQKLFADPVLKTMIQDGWDWTIIPSWVDTKFPKFADIAQKALNASNNVASLVGEIELAKTIADIMADGTAEGWESMAIAAVQSMNAPAAHYAPVILEFVSQFSGGEGAPLIMFLDSVAKQFCCNAVLGEEFWTVVTRTVLTKTKQLPLVRCALILANLTSTKFVDGIAKMLVRSDVSKLTTKAFKDDADKAETILSQARQIVDTLQAQKQLELGSDTGPLGRLWVRVIMKTTNKEKEGREQRKYEFKEMKSLFLDELSAIVGTPVTYDRWTDAAAPKIDPVTNTPRAAAVSLDQHSDPIWLAAQAGITVGKAVYERKMGYKPEGVFVVTIIEPSHATLKKCCPYDGINTIAKVDLESLITEWTLYKQDTPYRMECGEHRTISLQHDLVKTNLFQAAMAANGKVESGLVFFRRPDVVCASKPFKKGELVLAPVAPLANYTVKKVANAFCIGQVKDIDYYVIPPVKPPTGKAFDEWKDDANVLGMWWVEETDDENEVNMHIVSKRFDSMNINVMTNCKALEAHTKLKKLKPILEKRALDNVISTVTTSASSKKRKTK